MGEQRVWQRLEEILQNSCHVVNCVVLGVYLEPLGIWRGEGGGRGEGEERGERGERGEEGRGERGEEGEGREGGGRGRGREQRGGEMRYMFMSVGPL